MITDVKSVQSVNVHPAISFIPTGKEIDVNELQPLNIYGEVAVSDVFSKPITVVSEVLL